MNATTYINNAHKALSRNPGGLTIEELSGKLRVKALKISQQIRELHDAGLIETTEDAGQPVYRLIAAPAAESVRDDSEGGETDAPLNFATSPELQYLAPEDYEMPPADPVLLASANKMLCERMEAIAEQLRAGTIPELENVTGAEDLAPHVKTLCDALAAAESVVTARGHTINGYRLEVADLRERLDAQIKQWQADTGRLTSDLRAAMESRSQTINEADRLRAELAAERQAREALQEQANAVDVKDAAVGYLIRVPKRDPILRRKLDSARLAALGAVRAGAARAEVLAVVPVGAARRGAEWGDA